MTNMTNQVTRVLTGITTSGIPHLGNYAGAIRPAVVASGQPGVDSFLFMADYHALIKCQDADLVAHSRMAVAATWLACGLNPDDVTFYRQSDIPEIAELCWVLNCMTPKGLMNRAHAYKASVDVNVEKDVEPDDGITMGLFSYPVLMAADILMFSANKVPVGRDQIQHIEMARDIAQRFNHHYCAGRELLVQPEVLIEDDVATLPGLDGRKMSKSYGNVIPLFEGGKKALKDAVARIITTSELPGQTKNPDESNLYTLYRAFATSEQSQKFRHDLEAGMGWGQAKDEFFNLLSNTLDPMRDVYEYYMAKSDLVEEILQAGALKARKIAQPLMDEVRQMVGLRKIVAQAADTKTKKEKTARWVSFKEGDKFGFRLVSADGVDLLISENHADPKSAGLLMKSLATAAWSIQHNQLMVDGQAVAQVLNSQDADESQAVAQISAALASMQ